MHRRATFTKEVHCGVAFMHPTEPVNVSAFRFGLWGGFVLERDFHACAVGGDLAVFDDEVLLGDFGDAQVAQALPEARSTAAFAAFSHESVLVPTSSMIL